MLLLTAPVIVCWTRLPQLTSVGGGIYLTENSGRLSSGVLWPDAERRGFRPGVRRHTWDRLPQNESAKWGLRPGCSKWPIPIGD